MGWLRGLLTGGLSASLALTASAQEPPTLPDTRVIGVAPADAPPAPVPPAPPPEPEPTPASGRALPVTNDLGGNSSASEGLITPFDIRLQPTLRPAQILEQVPGLVVTQHSGSGKANQFFLRGFNLDHGTDFAAYIESVPWNLPTSAHGQGYLDLNSLIPELIGGINYYKGPYYAQLSDFSSAGAVQIRYVDRLDQGFARSEVGLYDWYRALLADSGDLLGGTLLYAFETNYYNGPWDFGENYRKFNGILKYSRGDADNGLSFTVLGYSGVWRATNQIPARAVGGGLINRFGSLDPTDNGSTRRLTLSGQAWTTNDAGDVTRAAVYGFYYSLNLFSNFTFFLDNPVLGDQFQQYERRWMTGCDLSHEWKSRLFEDCMLHRVGIQVRNDNIPIVALRRSSAKNVYAAVREDAVDQTLSSIYYINETQWLPKVRTVLGARGDYYSFDVASALEPLNSGSAYARKFNPKASLIVGPFAATNFYLSGGYGYHSNDARGTTQRIDPVSGDPLDPIPGLVQSRGAEIGVRSQAIPRLTSSAALWYLRLASELVFVGDAGTTEPNRASERYGLEVTNAYQFTDTIYFDVDCSFSHARFLGSDPETPGNHIPLSVGTVISAGPEMRLPSGWFGSFKMRHFGGARPLVEDNSITAPATTSFDMLVGYERKDFSIGVMFLNLFNSNDHDMEYYYESQLRTDSAPVADIHFHPLEPFNVRFWATWKF